MASHVRVKANRYNHIVALFVCLGSYAYGFNSGVIGAVIGLPSWYSYFGMVSGSAYAASIIDASNGLYYAGGFFGCLTVNWLSDTLGRRLAIQLIVCLIIVATVIQTGSVHIAMFIVGRLLGGIGAGMINSTVPTYISEIAPASQRGRSVGFHGVLTVTAYGMVGWAGLGTYFETNPQIRWRLLLALQLCAPLILLVGSFKLPESPRWLINKGRDREGLATLEKLHQSPSDPMHIGAKEEFVQIQAQLQLERKEAAGNIFSLLKNKRYRKRLLTGFMLQIITQTTGVLVINNYMILELAVLGVTGWQPLMINGFYNSWAAALNIVNAFTVDRFGRIRIITLGISGGIFSVIMVTALVANFGSAENTNSSAAIATIFFMFLFVTFYGSCVDAPTYIYCSEIFPTHIRAQGVGFATSGVFLMNTIYLISAGKAFTNIGWKFYLVFIIVPALSLPIIVWFFPETKGLTLEEIGALFGDHLALDIAHLSEPERTNLDKNLEHMDADHMNVEHMNMEHINAGEKDNDSKQQWTKKVEDVTIQG